MLEKTRFYIDGEWVAPQTLREFHVIDPSTEEPCAVISLGEDADADRAVAAAKRAFETWSQTEPAERLQLVERLSAAPTVRVTPGRYTLALGIRDPWTRRPGIGFANALPRRDGWTLLSELDIASTSV